VIGSKSLTPPSPWGWMAKSQATLARALWLCFPDQTKSRTLARDLVKIA
jgi:hypothetical protein